MVGILEVARGWAKSGVTDARREASRNSATIGHSPAPSSAQREQRWSLTLKDESFSDRDEAVWLGIIRDRLFTKTQGRTTIGNLSLVMEWRLKQIPANHRGGENLQDRTSSPSRPDYVPVATCTLPKPVCQCSRGDKALAVLRAASQRGDTSDTTPPTWPNTNSISEPRAQQMD